MDVQLMEYETQRLPSETQLGEGDDSNSPAPVTSDSPEKLVHDALQAEAAPQAEAAAQAEAAPQAEPAPKAEPAKEGSAL